MYIYIYISYGISTIHHQKSLANTNPAPAPRDPRGSSGMLALRRVPVLGSPHCILLTHLGKPGEKTGKLMKLWVSKGNDVGN